MGRECDAAPAKRTHQPPRLIRMMKWKICKGITIPYCIRQICNSKERHLPPKRGTNPALRRHHSVTPKGRGSLRGGGGLFYMGDTRRGPKAGHRERQPGRGHPGGLTHRSSPARQLQRAKSHRGKPTRDTLPHRPCPKGHPAPACQRWARNTHGDTRGAPPGRAVPAAGAAAAPGGCAKTPPQGGQPPGGRPRAPPTARPTPGRHPRAPPARRGQGRVTCCRTAFRSGASSASA